MKKNKIILSLILVVFTLAVMLTSCALPEPIDSVQTVTVQTVTVQTVTMTEDKVVPAPARAVSRLH